MCVVKHWGQISAVEGPVAQHGEHTSHQITASSCQGDERQNVAISLQNLASVVAPRDRISQGGKCGEEQALLSTLFPRLDGCSPWMDEPE